MKRPNKVTTLFLDVGGGALRHGSSAWPAARVLVRVIQTGWKKES
jgi:hypothetical protein